MQLFYFSPLSFFFSLFITPKYTSLLFSLSLLKSFSTKKLNMNFYWYNKKLFKIFKFLFCFLWLKLVLISNVLLWIRCYCQSVHFFPLLTKFKIFFTYLPFVFCFALFFVVLFCSFFCLFKDKSFVVRKFLCDHIFFFCFFFFSEQKKKKKNGNSVSVSIVSSFSGNIGQKILSLKNDRFA